MKSLTTGLALALFGATHVAALDCSAPQTQSSINECAVHYYQLADDDLNLAYGLAREMARQIDSDNATGQASAVTLWRDAQRAWISYRDLACSAESLLAAGGSMQPALRFGCLERMTRARTEDLRYFGEMH